MDTVATLCEACSTLNIEYLAHPLLPCRSPLPCSTPPIDRYLGAYIVLGLLMGSRVDAQPAPCTDSSLVAYTRSRPTSCHLRESAQFCNFRLPIHVEARDPTIAHVHLTQASVIVGTIEANQFHGPFLPWEVKARDDRASHSSLNFQVGDLHLLIRLMLISQTKTRARSFP